VIVERYSPSTRVFTNPLSAIFQMSFDLVLFYYRYKSTVVKLTLMNSVRNDFPLYFAKYTEYRKKIQITVVEPYFNVLLL
jgi:hypothetical protein